MDGKNHKENMKKIEINANDKEKWQKKLEAEKKNRIVDVKLERRTIEEFREK